MADRRMFSKTIIDSDAFLDMPLETQAFYFHLSMRADDEGFVNNPKKIARMIGVGEDSLKLLILKNFIIPFESGIVVIRHWKIHNYIRGDRMTETNYKNERSLLSIDDNGAYSLENLAECQPVSNQLTTNCQPVAVQMSAQDRIGKDRIGKDNTYSAEIVEIVGYLNQKANTRYRAGSDSTKKHIHARLNDGFTVDDFKTVIDKKCAEWIGTQWEKFLRPETLFGSKFESYLNANLNPVSDNGAQRLPTDEDYMGEGVF